MQGTIPTSPGSAPLQIYFSESIVMLVCDLPEPGTAATFIAGWK